MTPQEKRIFTERFMARRTSRIVGLQNGYAEFVKNFAAGPYEHDTLEDLNTDNGAPDTTTRTDSVGDSDWQGTVPGGSNDDTAITGALDILQKHIEGLGNADILAAWASTSDALRKTVSSGMTQASPNADGVTEGVRHVPDNTNSQTPGSHGYISTSELSKMEAEAAQLTKMTSRVVLGSGDKL